MSKECKVLFFDTETNGFQGSSVLSFSAYLVNYRIKDNGNVGFKILDKIDRYYYPQEPYNEGAIKVNGLDEETITDRRGNAEYPRYFKADEYIEELCKDVDKFIAHNINFDQSFMPIIIPKEKQYCTMLANVDVLKLPPKNPTYIRNGKVYASRGYKWPKLSECVEYYGIESDSSMLHNSLYDVEMLFKVFMKMAKSDEFYDSIYKFLFD